MAGNVPSTIPLYIPLQQGCPCDPPLINVRRAGSFEECLLPYLPTPTPLHLLFWHIDRKPGGATDSWRCRGQAEGRHPGGQLPSWNSARIISGISVSTCPKGDSGSFHFITTPAVKTDQKPGHRVDPLLSCPSPPNSTNQNFPFFVGS